MEHSILDISHLLDYQQADFGHSNKLGMIRRLGKENYPRFHLHISMINGGDYGQKFDLCLERSPNLHDTLTYGSVLKKEARRIQKLLTEGLS